MKITKFIVKNFYKEESSVDADFCYFKAINLILLNFILFTSQILEFWLKPLLYLKLYF